MMFGLHRKSRAEKVKEALLSAASYADGALRDTSLHDDLRSAGDHGAVAMRRMRKNVGMSSLVIRLVEDKKLRKHMRAMLDDLDSAGDRIRGRKRHRLRNVLLLAGVGSAVVAIPDVRRWVSARAPIGDNGGSETLATAT
jgi:hypothetical protein